jgi:alpha-tubulin suppressor-like RCC1 family protein
LGADENGAPLRVVSLSCASDAVCAAFDDGRVKCWGRNDYGQLGRGTNSLIEKSYVGNAAGEMGDALPFLYLGDGKRALKLSAGEEHFCAVLDTHELKCWGRNYMGAVGAGSSAARTLADLDGVPYDEQDTIVDLGTDAFCRPLRVVDVATMEHSTCALLENGRVKCFGSNDEGRLGLGVSSGHHQGTPQERWATRWIS